MSTSTQATTNLAAGADAANSGRVQQIVLKLSRMVTALQFLAGEASIIAILCAVIPLAAVIVGPRRTGFFTTTNLVTELLIAELVCAGVGIVSITIWSRIRSSARVLYQELADEVEWRHRTFKPEPVSERGSETRDRPELDIRVALRRFLAAEALTWVGVRWAPTLYSAYFLACLIGFTVVLRFGGNFADSVSVDDAAYFERTVRTELIFQIDPLPSGSSYSYGLTEVHVDWKTGTVHVNVEESGRDFYARMKGMSIDELEGRILAVSKDVRRRCTFLPWSVDIEHVDLVLPERSD